MRRPARADALHPPGEWGADIAVGSAQRLGVPMGFGGPHAGYMSVHKGLERQLPGRLVGVSVDCTRRARLPSRAPDARAAHPPREGHLEHLHRPGAARRHGSMYAVWHGPDGLARIAQRIRAHAVNLREALVAGGVDVTTDVCFDTSTISVPGRADEVVRRRSSTVASTSAASTRTGSPSASTRRRPDGRWRSPRGLRSGWVGCPASRRRQRRQRRAGPAHPPRRGRPSS